MLSNVSWAAPAGGNWATAADWSTGTVPGSGDTAIIGTLNPGAQVTYNTGTSTVEALQDSGLLTITGGTLTVTGSTTVTGTTLTLDGGTLAGTTLSTASGGVIETASGSTSTLDAATLGGNVTVTSGSTLDVADGLTFQSGSTITVDAGGTLNYVDGTSNTQIISGSGSIVLAAASGSYAAAQVNADGSNAGSSVTLANNVSITGDGSAATPNVITADAGNTIIVDGTITNATLTAASGGYLQSGQSGQSSLTATITSSAGGTTSPSELTGTIANGLEQIGPTNVMVNANGTQQFTLANFFSDSNSPTATPNPQVVGSSISIANVSGALATVTIDLVGTGFTDPLGSNLQVTSAGSLTWQPGDSTSDSVTVNGTVQGVEYAGSTVFCNPTQLSTYVPETSANLGTLGNPPGYSIGNVVTVTLEPGNAVNLAWNTWVAPASGSSAAAQATLDNVTLASNLTVESAATLDVADGLNLANGASLIAAPGANLNFVDGSSNNQTVKGTGSLVLDGASGGYIAAQINVNGPNAGSSITFANGVSITGNGSTAAPNVITAYAGNTIIFGNAVTNAKLSAASGGYLQSGGGYTGTPLFDGVTLASNLTIGGGSYYWGSTLDVAGGLSLENNATVSFGGYAGTLAFVDGTSPGQNVNGTGTIQLTNPLNGNSGSLTINASDSVVTVGNGVQITMGSANYCLLAINIDSI